MEAMRLVPVSFRLYSFYCLGIGNRFSRLERKKESRNEMRMKEGDCVKSFVKSSRTTATCTLAFSLPSNHHLSNIGEEIQFNFHNNLSQNLCNFR
jgi:hypothetical protein